MFLSGVQSHFRLDSRFSLRLIRPLAENACGNDGLRYEIILAQQAAGN